VKQIPQKTTGWGAGALAAAAALALLGAASSAQAAVIIWTLKDVVFDDGGTASGYFGYDTVLGTANRFNMTTTDGSRLSGFHYHAPATIFRGANFVVPDNLVWISPGHGLVLGFAGPLSAPGTVALTDNGGNLGGTFELQLDSSFRRSVRGISSGSVTGAFVPEPASWALMLLGFGGLGAALRRRRAALVAA
jgi:hypothetical protein